MINFENNSKEISRVYDLYQKATRKTGIEIVNRMAKNAAIKTISKMPILPAKEISKNNPKTFKGRRYPNRLHFARVSKKTPKGSGIRDAAEKSFNRAKSSRGFLKALFVNIAKDLGGTSKKSVVAGGSASKSKAALAKETKLFSSLKSGIMPIKSFLMSTGSIRDKSPFRRK